MDDEFIRVNAMATRAACARMTTMRLRALHDSAEHASCLPGKSAGTGGPPHMRRYSFCWPA